MRTFLTLMMLLSLVIFSFAQDTKSTDSISRASNKALSFSFNGLNLGEYYGGVGGKLWLSEALVLFASIDMDYDSNTQKKSTQTNGLKNTNFSTGLTVGSDFYLTGSRRFMPYIGFNAALGYSGTTLETDFANIDGKNITETGMFNFSLGAGLGVESFITSSISMAAQHVFSFGFGTGSRKTTLKRANQLDQVDESDLSNFNIGFGTSSLILSIYF